MTADNLACLTQRKRHPEDFRLRTQDLLYRSRDQAFPCEAARWVPSAGCRRFTFALHPRPELLSEGERNLGSERFMHRYAGRNLLDQFGILDRASGVGCFEDMNVKTAGWQILCHAQGALHSDST